MLRSLAPGGAGLGQGRRAVRAEHVVRDVHALVAAERFGLRLVDAVGPAADQLVCDEPVQQAGRGALGAQLQAAVLAQEVEPLVAQCGCQGLGSLRTRPGTARERHGGVPPGCFDADGQVLVVEVHGRRSLLVGGARVG